MSGCVYGRKFHMNHLVLPYMIVRLFVSHIISVPEHGNERQISAGPVCAIHSRTIICDGHELFIGKCPAVLETLKFDISWSCAPRMLPECSQPVA